MLQVLFSVIEAGYPSLATVNTILNDADIKPHNIRYYLEKRDPDFDRKMDDVLIVCTDRAAV